MSEMILIYVDGIQVLAPLESIYVPVFALTPCPSPTGEGINKNAVGQVEGGNQSNGKEIVT